MSALPVSAQTRTFYLDRLYMAGAPDDSIALWRPQVAPETRFFGQFGLGLGLNPFRVENMLNDEQAAGRFSREHGSPVSSQLIGYFNGGVELLDRFSFQVGLPIIALQTSNPTNDPNVLGAEDAASPATAALMDIRLDGRAILYRTEDRFFKLGANVTAWVPTGSKLSFSGDNAASAMIGLSGEIDLKSMFFVLNTGVHFRPYSSLNDFAVTNEWRWGLGGFLPLRNGALRLGAQIFGSTGLGRDTTFTGDNTPLEWMAEGRLALDQRKKGWLGVGAGTRLSGGYAPDFRMVGVIGYSFGIKDVEPVSPGRRFQAVPPRAADTDKDGLPDDIDLCPTDPEDGKPPNADDGCPALPDRDGDGIPDISDKCPDQPEDFDKINDADGCPEDDADEDSIPDAKDACPKEPGQPSPEPTKNGCPQFIRRITGSSEIQILKQVQFATGSARILPNSYSILDEVVRLLKVNPEITLVAIEGHTDNRGSDQLNEKLSNDRAHSVRTYLIERGGIDPARLTAAGFGPKRPIDDNNTEAGRQKNRRVEFHIRESNTGGNKAGGDKGGGTVTP
ncbi:putative membrane protein [Sorangium cellulosum So ce56]|uniref:Membrane protein n=1 Tax=Sorangium cellulosum (strain So ce56) TaxID=448385 RepID=A9G6E8_SORC5|nr:OmpA family protein [Sorangium cellulosum]CAN92683.1 putative membrane protein [Sorangium cellulosum So ce56]